jgi:hypothetical protein
MNIGVEQDRQQTEGWFVGDAGEACVQRLVVFLNQRDEPSRTFCHRLCSMPGGSRAFRHAGGDATFANVGADRMLMQLAPRLSLDHLIEMLQNSNAPSELVQAMNAPADTMLRVAVRNDDVAQMQRLLDELRPASLADLLLLAVRCCGVDAVRFLIERGADVSDSLVAEALSPSSRTMQISTDVVRLLVGAGAGKGIALTHNQVYSVTASGIDLCRLLITADTDPSIVQECLNRAVGFNRANVIAHCLDLGASLDAQVIARSIGHSVACFHVFQSRHLLDASALAQAVKHSVTNVDCLTLILEAGATVDDPELLLYAARFASPTVVQRLVEAGADFRALSLHSVWSNRSSQSMHAKRANSSTFEAVLAAGADVDALDDAGHSVLFAMLESIFYTADVQFISTVLAVAPEVPDAAAVIALASGRVVQCAQESQRYGFSEVQAQQHGSAAQSVCALLVAAGWDDPALVAGAGADAFPLEAAAIEAIRRRLIRPRIVQICIGLQALQLPALISLTVVDAAIAAAPWSSMHWKWKVITTIKHK